MTDKNGLREMPFHPSRRRIISGIASLGVLMGGPVRNAFGQAPKRVIVPEGDFAPLPIAIPNFVAGSPADGEVGVSVAQVITNNLKRSGLFAPIDQAAFIEKIANIDAAPQFQNWKTINAQALVTGRMTKQPDGRLKAEFRLWDVNTAQQLTGQQYFTSPEYWRRIAHIISDQIYERLTGEKGYFDSRVVFVDETGSKERRVKRLALMDQDGANVRYLTRGADLVLTPRFSPSTQEITYMEFGQGDPRVYLYRIETGEREIVGNFPGMSFSPRFSPDGQRVIMSLQQGGNSNLQFEPVRDGPAFEVDHAADRYSGDRYLAVLCAGRHPYMFRIRPRWKAADLCDAGHRRTRAAHILWGGKLFDPGLVAAGRLHRLHQAGQRTVFHRHHEARWFGRADSHLRLPQRRTDLCAERPRPDVLPRSRRQQRTFAVHRGHFRTQRTARANPRLRVRSGVVTAAVVRSAAAGMGRAHAGFGKACLAS